ncbi:natural resistance-associated macrophage protein-domain-containing protein [Hygrophoropsis aurantiaca]|uniref:Natural resistance-associated macrophage protein-domain-containing protein n=1 Tax=Hygrophoropsis aurantiaca TaxID=72124 RepID=A0ACB8AQR0_9AGAM|nr:natural resistance-associated macrophage protein-domain-containing protein [Hygrophoropsis aurantiaca]
MSSPRPSVHALPPSHDLPPPSQPRENSRSAGVLKTVLHHFKKHVGVGIICAVGYFDPGNWSVDLQAGSSFGYRPMLFVILLAGVIAIILQVLAARLGCVTGLDLAAHCRLLLHDHPKYPRLVRRLVLYPLYVLCEIAIISTDLAELLGSAIGLCLIFPKLPLWAGVLLTGVDVFIFLIIGDPTRGGGRPVRLFEIVIILLVAVVFICFIILLIRVSPNWPDVFLGFIPDAGLLQSDPNAVYTAIGIIGATVMPHALFLGSFLSTQDRVTAAPAPIPLPSPSPQLTYGERLRRLRRSLFTVSRSEREDLKDVRTRYGLRENNSIQFIRAHINHGIVDVVLSLLAVAVPINSAILILAATVFYSPMSTNTGLFNMHTLIQSSLGSGAAFMFALALVCSGQTASVTATLAGQIVSEGFILWNISPFLRRLLTRLISLIPSMIVAVAFGKAGINTLLVASQVALSVVLPFVAFPLIYLTSSKTVMSVRIPRLEKGVEAGLKSAQLLSSLSDSPPPHVSCDHIAVVSTVVIAEEKKVEDIQDEEPLKKPSVSSSDEVIDFSSSYLLSALAYAIWVVVVIANFYAIAMLGMGETGQ